MGFFNRKKTEVSAPVVDATAEKAAEKTAASDTANDELIAVISAAIAAYEAEQFIQTLYIQKINRTCRILPAWGAMGTQEAIDSRIM